MSWFKVKQLPIGNAENMLNFVKSWERIRKYPTNLRLKLKESWLRKLSSSRRELAIRFSKSSIGFRFKALVEDWDEIRVQKELDNLN